MWKNVIGAILAIVLAACSSSSDVQDQGKKAPSPASGIYAIAALQPNGQTEVDDLITAKNTVVSSSYDGVSAWSAVSTHLMDGTVHSYDQIYNSLSKLSGYPKDLWLTIWTWDPGGWTNEAAWANAVTSWRNAAKAAKALGFKGILFDNECYGTNWMWDDGDSFKATARKRGKEIMAAVLQEWPTTKVFIYNGPSNADWTAKNNGLINSYPPDWTLSAEFIFGMMEAKLGYSGAEIIDGNGDYKWLTDAEYKTSYNLRKSGLSTIPSTLSASYSQNVSVGFLIYNQNWPKTVQTTLSMFTTKLTNAMKYADRYVGVYIETPGQGFGSNPGDWLYPTNGEINWINAIANAKASVKRNDVASE